MAEHDIPWERVVNIDETAVRLFPSNEYGWETKGNLGDRHKLPSTALPKKKSTSTLA